MSDLIHLLDSVCHDECTVWCQDPDESTASWEKALSVDLVTCVPCLQAVENVATRARMRLRTIAAGAGKEGGS